MKQLGWVADGYTHETEIGGECLFYRPLTSAERKDLWRLLSDEGPKGTTKTTLMIETMQSRIVGGWVDLHDVDLVDFRKATTLILMGSMTEPRDCRNLETGVKLEVGGKYPHLRHSSCDDCRVHWYDPETGTFHQQDGVYLDRPEGDTLLCEQPIGCPNGSWREPQALSEKNVLAYQHFLNCEATGDWDDDPIVKRNAAIIRRARHAGMAGVRR